MPFHGHEKTDLWSTLETMTVFVSQNHCLPDPTPVFCPIQILHYCNIALQISQVIQTVKNTNITFQLTTLSVNTLHSVNMYYL